MSEKDLYSGAIVIDGTCPLLRRNEFTAWYKEGGITACAPTVGSAASAGDTFKNLGNWLRLIATSDYMVHVRKAQDILDAKRAGKLGIIFHFQGADPIESDLDLVEAYQALGVRMIQLTYNVKNRVGDGCEERTDSGLSRFGQRLIRRLNENRIVVDCSHTGYTTTMEAIGASSAPVVFSHANPKGVYPSPRNIQDDQIKAVAGTGGLVGINGYPAFVSDSKRPTIDQFVAHVDYVAQLVGIDHVALGLDYFEGMSPVADDQEAKRMYDASLAVGRWNEASYPPPPYYYPEGIGTPREFGNIASALLSRGYSPDHVRKVLGENWLRVFRTVWGE